MKFFSGPFYGVVLDGRAEKTWIFQFFSKKIIDFGKIGFDFNDIGRLRFEFDKVRFFRSLRRFFFRRLRRLLRKVTG